MSDVISENSGEINQSSERLINQHTTSLVKNSAKRAVMDKYSGSDSDIPLDEKIKRLKTMNEKIEQITNMVLVNNDVIPNTNDEEVTIDYFLRHFELDGQFPELMNKKGLAV
jgi:glycerol-3-phosphate responsive antiterminator